MIISATMWDDGLVTDLKLLDLLRDLSLTANFAISPNRHGFHRVLNDYRNSSYGKLVSKSELKEFKDFEISNHTANHKDLTKLNCNEIKVEISDGKKLLEDIFERNVDGFCYPYGCYDNSISNFVMHSGHGYARTTKENFRFSCIKNPYQIITSCRWNSYSKINFVDGRTYIFWGHSYEICDWLQVKNFYEFIKNSTNVISFSELVKNVQSNSWKCFL